ncbi:MAG: DUF721 domain-containing protein [Flavobacteriaceae bacterium]|nr:MAG: DUF721 domain-containing protein [Flavobacteriaceae bacterium]
MSKRDKESNQIKDLIPQMLKENKLKKGMDQIQVKEVWQEVMGMGVANYTESVSLKNGVLLVRLKSSALREELNYGKSKIVSMMNKALNQVEIKEVKLI